MATFFVIYIIFLFIVMSFVAINFYHLYKNQGVGRMAITSIYFYMMLMFLALSYVAIRILEFYS